MMCFPAHPLRGHLQLKLNAIFAGLALAYSTFSVAAPHIEGNDTLSNFVIDRHLAYGNPKSIEQAGQIISGAYVQYGYKDVVVKVDKGNNKITIFEQGVDRDASFPQNEGFVVVNDIQRSMKMADSSPRFHTIDGMLGSLQTHERSGLGLSSKQDLVNLGVSYSSRGHDASSRDVVGISAAVHTSSGFSAEGDYLHGLEGMRSLSKEGRYDAGRVRLAQNTSYGEFAIGGDITGSDPGTSKKISRYQEELAGETYRAFIGHRYNFEGVGTLANSVTWIRREQTYDKYKIKETQEYQTWNTTYRGQYGASQFSASITKGLSGQRTYDYVPLMGEFNPNFYAVQLGYGIQGLALNDQIGYGITGSYFKGSEDMPSAERMTIGGSGRGSSHDAGLVSGYKGSFAEARLYGMNVPGLADLALKPYLSVNGARTTHPTGGEFEVVAAEVGITGSWKDVKGTLSYAKSVKDENLDHDSRVNLDVNYTF